MPRQSVWLYVPRATVYEELREDGLFDVNTTGYDALQDGCDAYQGLRAD